MAWYKCPKTTQIKLVPWSSGSYDEIEAMINGYYNGELSLDDIKSVWSVGDTRQVTFSGTAATGNIESHANQAIKFQILNFGGKKLASDGTTDVLAIVGQRDCLNEVGIMNSTQANAGGWDSCERRSWCNNQYREAIATSMRRLFKLFNNTTSAGSTGPSTAIISADYFALPSEVEVFGTTTYADATVEANNTQFEHMTTRKKQGSSYCNWWLRSPDTTNNRRFCTVKDNGTVYRDFATATLGIAPFGCI